MSDQLHTLTALPPDKFPLLPAEYDARWVRAGLFRLPCSCSLGAFWRRYTFLHLLRMKSLYFNAMLSLTYLLYRLRRHVSLHIPFTGARK